LLFIRDGAPNSAIRMHAATSAERKPLSVPHFPFPIFLFPLLPFSPFEFSSLQTLLFDVVFQRCIISFACQRQLANFSHIAQWFRQRPKIKKFDDIFFKQNVSKLSLKSPNFSLAYRILLEI